MNQIIIPNEAAKYILFQRTAYQQFANTWAYRVFKKYSPFSIYNQVVAAEAKFNLSRVKSLYNDDMQKEYLSIKGFLPDECSAILDIGCGVSGIDVFISRHYQNQKTAFYLLDKTHTEKSVFYQFKQKGAFYNSLEVAKELLLKNGIPEKDIHLLEADVTNEINIDFNVNLTISLISWGYHYPVETYLDSVYNLLSKDGRLIMDIRKGTDGMDKLKNKFGNLNIILDNQKFQRVLAIK